jgi:hypothetical protein
VEIQEKMVKVVTILLIAGGSDFSLKKEIN